MAAPFFLGAALLAIVATVGACSSIPLLTRVRPTPSPHERYADALRDNTLGNTALARDWLNAADRAMAQPLAVTTPMLETGYFAADRPSATAYRLELQRGRQLSIEITFDSTEPAQLFVDLFEVTSPDAPARVASLLQGATLTAEVPRDGSYVLRVQPELLRGGRYTIVQRTLASLPFPVEGLTARAVQSEFGAARDAGRREHEGIDIFASRNTPVVAVVDGSARSDTNPLGGNVVWLRDRSEARSFYYAHLTRAAFEGSSAVRVGDVIGYIGNTGNARTTAPHLHFGIYARGAIDPLPFLRADDSVPPPISDRHDWLGQLIRVSGTRVWLRAGTARDAAILTPLSRHSLARVVGVTHAQFRVELPNRSIGYLDRAAARLAQTALRTQRLRAGEVIRDSPNIQAPAITTIVEPVTVDVIGEFHGFALIRQAPGPSGWIDLAHRP